MNTICKASDELLQRTPMWGQLFLKMLGKIKKGNAVVVIPDGRSLNFSGSEAGENVRLIIHDWQFCENLFMKGDIGLGESYIQGLWDCDNIDGLIKFGIENSSELGRIIKGSMFKILFYRLKHLLNRNSKKGSAKNIRAHYDLGNDFYKLWLDSSMTYSSGLFKKMDNKTTYNEKLCEAQENKYENIILQLKLKEGDHVLEVGCGWGGFLEYAAKKGIKVTGVTISKEQFDYAKNRLSSYSHLASVQLTDYRDITGIYDHIVSIEMFEALGMEYWKTYFKKLYSLLRPGGQLVIQSITINHNDFSSYRRGTDFIQQYIFPGGMLPSPEIFTALALKQKFMSINQFEFGQDYARTLGIWEENFSQSLESVKKLGFDEKFIRLWTFYLKLCQGSFAAKKISVYQFCLSK
ncbi:MAG: class I SAM-dependent methyltransferase [Bacteriovorax sp.]|jgi:cyclopropane-fatty-acyl-phospholipid synthase|nr:class I SAM-dependent methyltransferase [Bacteriovorax sp.]